MIYAEALLWVVVVTYWLYRLIRSFTAQGKAMLYTRAMFFHLTMGVTWIGFGKSILERLLLALSA